MFYFSYFGNAYFKGKEGGLAFWKCVEKIWFFPFSNLTNRQQFNKLHVVYLNIRQ